MNMNKKDELLLKNLFSANRQTVTEAITEIKESGNSNLIPGLIEIYYSSADNEINKMIYSILAELKYTSAVPLIIEAIQNEKYADIRESLIKICWENGLDYTPYISLFTDLVISGDFMTAFEAFTVIENMEGSIPEEKVEENVVKLKKAVKVADKEKSKFLTDLISIIQQLKLQE